MHLISTTKHLIHIFPHRTEKEDFLTVLIPTITFLGKSIPTLGVIQINSRK